MFDNFDQSLIHQCGDITSNSEEITKKNNVGVNKDIQYMSKPLILDRAYELLEDNIVISQDDHEFNKSIIKTFFTENIKETRTLTFLNRKNKLELQLIIQNQMFNNIEMVEGSNGQLVLSCLLNTDFFQQLQDQNIRLTFENTNINDRQYANFIGLHLNISQHSDQTLRGVFNESISNSNPSNLTLKEQEIDESVKDQSQLQQGVCIKNDEANDGENNIRINTVMKRQQKKNNDIYEQYVELTYNNSMNFLTIKKLILSQNEYLHEIAVLKQLSNTNITLPLIDFGKKDSTYFYFEQAAGQKDLSAIKQIFIFRIQDKIQLKLYNQLLEYLFIRLFGKLKDLHRQKIAHSDIKPMNMVIGYDLDPYFIDFGGSIYFDSYSDYLSSYTQIFNLQIFLDSRLFENEQQIQICDLSQFALSFLFMLCLDAQSIAEFKNKKFNSLLQKYSTKHPTLCKAISLILNQCDKSIEIINKEQQDIIMGVDLNYFTLIETLTSLLDIEEKDNKVLVRSINKQSSYLIDFIGVENIKNEIDLSKTEINPIQKGDPNFRTYQKVTQKLKVNSFTQRIIKKYPKSQTSFLNICNYLRVCNNESINIHLKNEEHINYFIYILSLLNQSQRIKLNVKIQISKDDDKNLLKNFTEKLKDIKNFFITKLEIIQTKIKIRLEQIQKTIFVKQAIEQQQQRIEEEIDQNEIEDEQTVLKKNKSKIPEQLENQQRNKQESELKEENQNLIQEDAQLIKVQQYKILIINPQKKEEIEKIIEKMLERTISDQIEIFLITRGLEEYKIIKYIKKYLDISQKQYKIFFRYESGKEIQKRNPEPEFKRNTSEAQKFISTAVFGLFNSLKTTKIEDLPMIENLQNILSGIELEGISEIQIQFDRYSSLNVNVMKQLNHLIKDYPFIERIKLLFNKCKISNEFKRQIQQIISLSNSNFNVVYSDKKQTETILKQKHSNAYKLQFLYNSLSGLNNRSLRQPFLNIQFNQCTEDNQQSQIIPLIPLGNQRIRLSYQQDIRRLQQREQKKEFRKIKLQDKMNIQKQDQVEQELEQKERKPYTKGVLNYKPLIHFSILALSIKDYYKQNQDSPLEFKYDLNISNSFISRVAYILNSPFNKILKQQEKNKLKMEFKRIHSQPKRQYFNQMELQQISTSYLLSELELKGNQDIFDLKLNRFNLNNQNLKKISFIMNKQKSIKQIYMILNSNDLKPTNFFQFTQSLSSPSCSLQILRLDLWEYTPSQILLILFALKKNRNLKDIKLCFCKNESNSFKIKQIMDVLKVNQTAKSFEVKFDSINHFRDNFSLKRIIEAVQTKRDYMNLIKIVFSQCNTLYSAQFEELPMCDQKYTHTKTFCFFYNHQNNLKQDSFTNLISALTRSVLAETYQLSFVHSKINDIFLKQLIAILELHPLRKESFFFNFCQNQDITDEGFKNLVGWSLRYKKFKEINWILYQKGIDVQLWNEKFQRIIELQKQNNYDSGIKENDENDKSEVKQIKSYTFDLRYCSITEEGFTFLENKIKSFKGITQIKVQFIKKSQRIVNDHYDGTENFDNFELQSKITLSNQTPLEENKQSELYRQQKNSNRLFSQQQSIYQKEKRHTKKRMMARKQLQLFKKLYEKEDFEIDF